MPDPTTPEQQTGSDSDQVSAQLEATQILQSQSDAIAGERTLGEFRLLRRLGTGGMAEVWLAEQTSLKRHVALKLLRRELTIDPTYIRRFETEAKAAAGLNHPQIVQVYTVGEIDGQHYIAQEYVQGSTLKVLLQRKGPLSAATALHVMRQVAAALQLTTEASCIGTSSPKTSCSPARET
jgi:eukaryotic-like serine/threonine-protein kinase